VPATPNRETGARAARAGAQRVWSAPLHVRHCAAVRRLCWQEAEGLGGAGGRQAWGAAEGSGAGLGAGPAAGTGVAGQEDEQLAAGWAGGAAGAGGMAGAGDGAAASGAELMLASVSDDHSVRLFQARAAGLALEGGSALHAGVSGRSAEAREGLEAEPRR